MHSDGHHPLTLNSNGGLFKIGAGRAPPVV
jgi:hypothetical protein